MNCQECEQNAVTDQAMKEWTSRWINEMTDLIVRIANDKEYSKAAVVLALNEIRGQMVCVKCAQCGGGRHD